MGVRAMIRALLAPTPARHRAPTAELEQRISDVEAHAVVTDEHLDEMDRRLDVLEYRAELRRRRRGRGEP